MNRNSSAVLVAHGTRKTGGVAMARELARRVGETLDREVHVAFVDVLGPNPTEVLDSLPRHRPAVVVSAFLAAGYYVRVDVPAHVAVSSHPQVTVTRPLGPCAGTVRVMADRLYESGWRPGDSAILAAAGTSDAGAQSDLRQTAAMPSPLIGDRVELGYAATDAPTVTDAVEGGPRAQRAVIETVFALFRLDAGQWDSENERRVSSGRSCAPRGAGCIGRW